MVGKELDTLQTWCPHPLGAFSVQVISTRGVSMSVTQNAQNPEFLLNTCARPHSLRSHSSTCNNILLRTQTPHWYI